MKKFSIYLALCIVLLSISVISLVTTVAKTLPACVSICDVLGLPLGSGVIVAPGYVLTANHVPDEGFAPDSAGNKDIYVHFLAVDKLVKVTKVIPLCLDKGYPIDACILKVDTGKLPSAPLGPSAPPEVASQVFAVGSPYLLENTVTVGIVSALHRDFNVDSTIYVDLIQVSGGMVFPGNSGGPLLDAQGRVVGVNVVGVGDTGMGFAVPIFQVKTGMHRVGLL